jgi:cytochrome c oxidase subunit 3
MAHRKNHDYHILPPSVWLLTTVAVFIMLFGAVLWMDSVTAPVPDGLRRVLYCMYARGGLTLSLNPTKVIHASRQHRPAIRVHYVHHVEIMFFAAWFWSFFKHAMYPMGPQSPVDGQFPPQGLKRSTRQRLR